MAHGGAHLLGFAVLMVIGLPGSLLRGPGRLLSSRSACPRPVVELGVTHPERLQGQRDITRNVRFELLQLFESPIAEDSQWYVSGI